MRIGVVGINHKLAGLKLREQLAKSCLRQFNAANSPKQPHDFVILTTCNRTEIYFHSEDLPATHTQILGILRDDIHEEFDQKLYSYFGQDCLQHLCRVAAGLDSAIVAETEIQGQVKAAYEQALELSLLPEELHYLFQKSLKIGKQVRSQLPIQRGLPDIEHAILQIGDHLFQSQQVKILFVGASDINRKILAFFKGKHYTDITICNRTAELAEEMANAYELGTLPWNQLQSRWHAYDWIVFGTKAPEPLIGKEHLPHHAISRKLIIDLSVPRNVEACIAKDPRITLMNIDQIDRTLSFRRKQIHHLLGQAETLIESSARLYTQLFQEKQKQRDLWLSAAV